MTDGILSRHIGKGFEIELETENGQKDVFILQTLPTEYLIKYLKVMQYFMKHKKQELEDEETASRIFAEAPEEILMAMKDLVLATMKESYPNEDEKVLEKFTMKNFLILWPAVVNANSSIKVTK